MTKQYKNWGDYKDALLEEVGEREKATMGVLFENVHRQLVDPQLKHNEGNHVLVESGDASSTLTGNITRYDTIFMPLARRIQTALIATDLVGVQPLSAPRGIVRTIRKMYAEDTKLNGADVTKAGDEADGVNVYENYTKLALGGNYEDIENLDPFERTQYLESNRGKPMNLEVVTDSVETEGRKVHAAWSLEAQDDLQALDGLSVESEMSITLADELVREQDRELLHELRQLAGAVKAMDFANIDGRYAGEKLAALSIFIDSLSDSIAVRTRQAGANWMVISQSIFTGLKNASNGAFVPANGGELQYNTSLFVGTIGNIRVYVDPYAEADSILMGYKGSEINTGLIYCPYIPIASSGVLTDTDTGDQRILMRTRYGLYKKVDPKNSLGDSSDFYARATIANIEFGFKN